MEAGVFSRSRDKQTIAAMEEVLALIADKDAKMYSVEEALQELKK